MKLIMENWRDYMKDAQGDHYTMALESRKLDLRKQNEAKKTNFIEGIFT